MKRWLPLFCFLMALASFARGADLPIFASDAEADQWLRHTSPYYAMMAEAVDHRGGYEFRSTTDYEQGVVTYEGARRCIELNPALTGPKRVSVIVFELTNAYQEQEHQEVDARARDGRITDAIHFGLMHELVEYDGLRHHRKVLAELDKALGGIPRPMLTWVNPKLTTLDSYELPSAFAYIEAQAQSGHTEHYRLWFAKQKEQGVAKAEQ